MTYSNGTAAQPGDIIMANISGQKYPFVVVSLAPASFPGSGLANPPGSYLAAVPFDAEKQINFAASSVELWADAMPGVPPIAPSLLR